MILHNKITHWQSFPWCCDIILVTSNCNIKYKNVNVLLTFLTRIIKLLFKPQPLSFTHFPLYFFWYSRHFSARSIHFDRMKGRNLLLGRCRKIIFYDKNVVYNIPAIIHYSSNFSFSPGNNALEIYSQLEASISGDEVVWFIWTGSCCVILWKSDTSNEISPVISELSTKY